VPTGARPLFYRTALGFDDRPDVAPEPCSRASLEPMADEQWAVTVTLSNGDTRALVNSAGTLEQAKATLDAFIKNEKPFRGDWVAAEDVWVARAHVVEATVNVVEP
jgi:hypothetical protein